MRIAIDWKATAIASAATISGIWGGVHPLMQLLFYLMVLDVTSGLIAGYVTRSLSSVASLRGIAKKCMMLVLVASAEMVGQAVGVTLGTISMFGSIAGLGAGCAGGFCITEILSIVENADRAGVRIPPAIRKVFAKLNQETMQEEFDSRQHDLNVASKALEMERSNSKDRKKSDDRKESD